MTITLNGTSGINTPGVVNTAAQTVATTLAVTGAATLSSTLAVTGVTTIAAGSAAAPALVGATGGATTGVWFPAASTVAFANAGVESARIDTSGNLLVACTAVPSSTVAGIRLNNPAAASPRISVGATTASNVMMYFTNGNGDVGSIATNGSATAYNTSSDYRLKENIAPMIGALAKVQALKPVTYKWKVDGSNGEGFIAHELQEVVPDCVVGEKDAVDADGNPKYQGIDTSFLVATLTAAIQEQQALITALTARITALENK